MTRRLTTLVVLGLGLGLLTAWGCGGHRVQPMERPEGKLAVAGFTSPRYDWQLLAGYIPEEGRNADMETLAKLDESMINTLAAHGAVDYVSPSATRQCQDIATFDNGGGKHKTALDYWVQVGQCMHTDYLLVPQVLYWRERAGDEWTVEEPAGVVLDLYLIDVNDPSRIVRKHYDETQQPLSEDLGHAGKFFDRGGEWVTADVLANEGLDKMLYELGL